MFAAFFVFLCVEAQLPVLIEIYGLVDSMLGSLLVWLTLIICTLTVFIPELMVKNILLGFHDSKE